MDEIVGKPTNFELLKEIMNEIMLASPNMSITPLKHEQ